MNKQDRNKKNYKDKQKEVKRFLSKLHCIYFIIKILLKIKLTAYFFVNYC